MSKPKRLLINDEYIIEDIGNIYGNIGILIIDVKSKIAVKFPEKNVDEVFYSMVIDTVSDEGLGDYVNLVYHYQRLETDKEYIERCKKLEKDKEEKLLREKKEYQEFLRLKKKYTKINMDNDNDI